MQSSNSDAEHPGPLVSAALAALQRTILDGVTSIVDLPEGSACILPVEEYVTLVEMQRVLRLMIIMTRDRDMEGLVDEVEAFSTWVLEGGGNYTRGGPDA